MKKLRTILTLWLVFVFLSAACASPATQPAAGEPASTQPPAAVETQQAAQPAGDLLSAILARGTLVVSTDPAYPPQSELVKDGARAAETKCAADQHTTSELKGFDISSAAELAKRLGVEACFVTPDWTLITGGNWSGRWDISIGSMTVTPERMEKLYFTQPYYTTPAAFFVHKDNQTYSQPADLSGKKIGACTGCTYDSYLLKKLTIPGETIEFVVNDPVFTGYDTDINALQDLALGDGTRLDAVLTAQPTGQGAIADGMPLKQLGDPIFFEYLSGAVDKASGQDPVPFVQKATELLQQMHADGTLLKISQEYYGEDLTTAAAEFDVSTLKQW